VQLDSALKINQSNPRLPLHFTRGGDLIAGINSNIAFIANNQFGKPVQVRGAIFNNLNQLMDSFVTVHDGMGKFALEPSAKETYYANWVDEYGISHITDLPKQNREEWDGSGLEKI